MRAGADPRGGYFLWLDLPGGANARAALHAAQGIGVAFIAGPDFYLAGGGRSRPGWRTASPPGAATGGCQAPGGGFVRGACGRPATAARRLGHPKATISTIAQISETVAVKKTKSILIRSPFIEMNASR